MAKVGPLTSVGLLTNVGPSIDVGLLTMTVVDAGGEVFVDGGGRTVDEGDAVTARAVAESMTMTGVGWVVMTVLNVETRPLLMKEVGSFLMKRVKPLWMTEVRSLL